VPLVSADPLGRFVSHWVSWAGRVTVRRLRDDLEHALALAETDPEGFRRTGGRPVEARRRHAGDETSGKTRSDREIRAIHRAAGGESEELGREGSSTDEEAAPGAERETGAAHRDGSPTTAAWRRGLTPGSAGSPGPTRRAGCASRARPRWSGSSAPPSARSGAPPARVSPRAPIRDPRPWAPRRRRSPRRDGPRRR
jgi:hypothetical protein